jgi:hypothetical protein
MIADLDSRELLELVRSGELDELTALQVLRSPFCTAQIAELIASDRRLLDPHGVRELLAGFPGFNFSQAVDLLATLPWGSLLAVSQAPRTPPVVRRHAERKLLTQLPSMVLGERIALARRAHRALFRALTASGDPQVLIALLNNPRLVENDILVIVNTAEAPPEFLIELARHPRWGSYRDVRRAIVESRQSPLPLALSMLVQLAPWELRSLLGRRGLSDDIRAAARSLLDREARGLRGVLHSESENGDGGAAQPPEDLR